MYTYKTTLIKVYKKYISNSREESHQQFERNVILCKMQNKNVNKWNLHMSLSWVSAELAKIIVRT